MLEFVGKYSKAVVMIDEVEPETIKQIYEFLKDPSFVDSVIMPDCHKGEGAVIGFTMPLPLNGRIIPSIVGVDQSCGMLCARIRRQLQGYSREVFADVDKLIRTNLPMGKAIHSRPLLKVSSYNWKRLIRHASNFTEAYNRRFGTNYAPPDYSTDWFRDFCKRIGIDEGYAVCSIGTLGGGNHFIEFGIDEQGRSYLTIHSGSRNLGKRAADYWTDRAVGRTKEDVSARRKAAIEEIKRCFPKSEWQSRFSQVDVQLPKKEGLAYLEGHAAFGYLTDALFCHEYAHENREVMLSLLDTMLDLGIEDTIETVHNYISPDDLIIRKGAVSAHKGEQFILPFNMEDGILLCEGKGNPKWNFSAPHGAGRVYGRADAKRKLNLAAAEKSMSDKGVFISTLPLDEAKGAYKKAEIIEAAIEPTAKILHRIKPKFVLKSKE